MQSHQIGVCRILTLGSVRTTASHLSLLSAPVATSRILPVSSPGTSAPSRLDPTAPSGTPRQVGQAELASELGSLAVLGVFLELPVYERQGEPNASSWTWAGRSGHGLAVTRNNLADQRETDTVAPTVVGQALVGSAEGETLEQSRQDFRVNSRTVVTHVHQRAAARDGHRQSNFGVGVPDRVVTARLSPVAERRASRNRHGGAVSARRDIPRACAAGVVEAATCRAISTRSTTAPPVSAPGSAASNRSSSTSVSAAVSLTSPSSSPRARCGSAPACSARRISCAGVLNSVTRVRSSWLASATNRRYNARASASGRTARRPIQALPKAASNRPAPPLNRSARTTLSRRAPSGSRSTTACLSTPFLTSVRTTNSPAVREMCRTSGTSVPVTRCSGSRSGRPLFW
jgi:hypothetical protein